MLLLQCKRSTSIYIWMTKFSFWTFFAPIRKMTKKIIKMFNFLNHFNGCSQIEWISKKYIICSSSAIIKSFIACFDFDIFEWKVEKFNVFLKKQEQKKLKFSTSIPNFEMDFHRIINPILGKGSLSHILCLIAKSFTYCPNISWIFSFFKLRQRMQSHFKICNGQILEVKYVKMKM